MRLGVYKVAKIIRENEGKRGIVLQMRVRRVLQKLLGGCHRLYQNSHGLVFYGLGGSHGRR